MNRIQTNRLCTKAKCGHHFAVTIAPVSNTIVVGYSKASAFAPSFGYINCCTASQI